MIQLYSLTTSGEIKTLKFRTEGAKFITEHGRLDGKMQTSVKICEGKNEGRANEKTPAEQAIAEMNAKIQKKTDEGYSTEMPVVGTAVVNAEVSLVNLPASFCPSKPISKCPVKVENGVGTYAQRKYNGNCLILTKMRMTEKVYSRRMEDLTEYLIDVPVIAQALNCMSSGDMLNTEITFFKNDGRESTRAVGSLVRTKDRDEVMRKYSENSKVGKYKLIVFDMLFQNGIFIGDEDYIQRYNKLNSIKGIFIPELYFNWREQIAIAQKEKWEGFVLRVQGDSAVSYSLNGKAERAGCYKYKFVKEGDFVVSAVEKGEAGRHATVYAKFKIGQYRDGELLDCGWAGPGTLTHEELEQYTKEIDSKKLKLPFVVEIEFRDWQEENFKLEHPVIQRIRFDKKPSECEYEG